MVAIRRRLVKRALEMNIDVPALDQWAFQINHVEPRGKVYLLETDLGPKCLKMRAKTDSEVKELFLLMEHLAHRGFKNIPRFIRTKFGEPYVKTGNCYYFIYDWVSGRPVNLQAEDDLGEAARQLAYLHHRSKGFLPNREKNAAPVFFNWQRQFQDIALKILETKSKIGEVHYLINSLHLMLARAAAACKILKDSGYKVLRLQAQKEAGFCHGAYDHHHIIINNLGGIFVSGFDEWVRDIRLKDLAGFIYLAGKANDWNSEMMLQVVANYDSCFALYPAELEIIQAYICFPFEYWELLKQIWQQLIKPGDIQEQADKYLELDEAKQRCLGEMARW
jgi:CotS family spore coat protein